MRYWYLWNIDWVLLGFTEFYWVLLGFTGFYWVLLGFTGFYWVSISFHQFPRENRSAWPLYWVLLGFTEFFSRFSAWNGTILCERKRKVFLLCLFVVVFFYFSVLFFFVSSFLRARPGTRLAPKQKAIITYRFSRPGFISIRTSRADKSHAKRISVHPKRKKN